jgi:phosphoribosylanthranilate isomerase
MRKRLADGITTVGVFVNEPRENIVRLVKSGVIGIAQLHGDEDEEYISRLRDEADCGIIKAVRVRSADDIPTATAADFLLFDAFSGAAYGGTGEMFDHSLIKSDKPFFLAGGLNSDNIEAAVRKTKPYAVDLSSGIETDGFKDRDKILDIVRRIRNV